MHYWIEMQITSSRKTRSNSRRLMDRNDFPHRFLMSTPSDLIFFATELLQLNFCVFLIYFLFVWTPVIINPTRLKPFRTSGKVVSFCFHDYIPHNGGSMLTLHFLFRIFSFMFSVPRLFGMQPS